MRGGLKRSFLILSRQCRPQGGTAIKPHVQRGSVPAQPAGDHRGHGHHASRGTQPHRARGEFGALLFLLPRRLDTCRRGGRGCRAAEASEAQQAATGDTPLSNAPVMIILKMSM